MKFVIREKVFYRVLSIFWLGLTLRNVYMACDADSFTMFAGRFFAMLFTMAMAMHLQNMHRSLTTRLQNKAVFYAKVEFSK